MVGLVGALELCRPGGGAFEDTGAIGTRCRDLSVGNGLVMRAVRDTMIISPPLVISEEECAQLVERAGKTLDDLADALTRDGAI